MTELELYKFVHDNDQEYHWNDNDVLLFVDTWQLDKFIKILGAHILDEEGINCTLKEFYLVFKMTEICEELGIDINNVFKKEV